MPEPHPLFCSPCVGPLSLVNPTPFPCRPPDLTEASKALLSPNIVLLELCIISFSVVKLLFSSSRAPELRAPVQTEAAEEEGPLLLRT